MAWEGALGGGDKTIVDLLAWTQEMRVQKQEKEEQND